MALEIVTMAKNELDATNSNKLFLAKTDSSCKPNVAVFRSTDYK